jgi:hypothetical protein
MWLSIQWHKGGDIMSIDFMDLWERTIQSQYGTSAHLKGIVEAFAKQIDPTIDIATFYEKMFDPRTAEGIGLDIWGAIVGADRYIDVDEEEYFGFLDSNLHPMNERPFYYDKGATKTYRMADNAYRELIFLKAFANIADATMSTLKIVINKLYEGSIAIEAEHMKIRVLFLSYDIPKYAFALLKRYGFFNLGAGVGWEYYIIDPDQTLGFGGSGLQTFGNGIFSPYDITQP